MDTTPIGILLSAGAVTALLVCALHFLTRSSLFKCKCPSCEGKGKCDACGGTGKNNGDVSCFLCDGSGECFVCGGKGSY
ncbi:MAG: hypothetical protein R6V62_06380 [Candidatus Fermentibacteraceae bacterium]